MSGRERLLTGVVVVAMVGACFMYGRVAGASAAPVPTFADACPTMGGSSDPGSVASCERLDYIASEASSIDAEGAGGIERLDLVWIGVWFVGGVAFGIAFAQKIWAEVRKWHGGWR